MHMITDGSRNADGTCRTFGLKAGDDIHGISMQVGSIGNCVTKVNPHAEADGSVRWLIAVVDRNLLLHLDSTSHSAIYAVEHYEQGIATGLDDPAAMLLDCRVDKVAS
jgi:hypothetical protein